MRWNNFWMLILICIHFFFTRYFEIEEISYEHAGSWNKECSIKKHLTPMWTLHESSSPPLLISPLFILMIWKNSCSVFSKSVSDAKKRDMYAAKSFFTRPRINYYRLVLQQKNELEYPLIFDLTFKLDFSKINLFNLLFVYPVLHSFIDIMSLRLKNYMLSYPPWEIFFSRSHPEALGSYYYSYPW